MKKPKPKTELNDCATALMKASALDETDYLRKLADEGHLWLDELEAVAVCEDPRIFSLSQRIKRVEEILDHRKQQIAGSARRRA
ncbi:MAG: hypothetical protein Q7R67_01975 [bacterium]|nr:hypothetical protein [bacterium]